MQRKEINIIYEGFFVPLQKYTYVIQDINHLYIIVRTIIFRTDILGRTWEKIGVIPKKYCKERLEQNNVCFDENKLYIFSNTFVGVYIFDTNTYQGEEIRLNDKNINGSYMVTQWKKFYILISFKSADIITFHKKTKEFFIFTEWKKQLMEYLREQNLEFLFVRYRDIFVYDNFIYLNISTNIRDLIIRLKLGSFDSIDIIDTGYGKENFGLLIQENYLYFQNITNGKHRIIQWNMNTLQTEQIWELKSENMEYRGEFYFCGTEIVFARRNEEIYVLSSKRNFSFQKVKMVGWIQSMEHCIDETTICLNKEGIYSWNILSDKQYMIHIPWLEKYVEYIKDGNENEHISGNESIGQSIYINL